MPDRPTPFADRPLDPHPQSVGDPWRLELTVHSEPGGHDWLGGALTRHGETIPLSAPQSIDPGGFLEIDGRREGFDHGGAYLLAATLRNVPRVPLAEGELAELLEMLDGLPRAPTIHLPPDVSIAMRQGEPKPTLAITVDPSPWSNGLPILTLGFQYGEARIRADDPRSTIFDKGTLTLLHRDPAAEQAALERLAAAGVREEKRDDPFAPTDATRLTIAKSKLSALILELVRDGWRIDSSGVRYRAPGESHAVVRSGIDWFDLDLELEYDGVAAPLPAIIDALRKRDATVKLSDGSVGLLPEEWIEQLGPIITAGRPFENAARFSRAQLGVLDALLAQLPDVSVDETFERAREKLNSFERITPCDPAPSFGGTLRDYQREGLGWLHFLREFGLGGCLADDMGLGKTIQVLALLDMHRTGQSIIVVPRSLIFNWMREAERFTPELKVLDFSGPRRRIEDIEASGADVVLTTYGTLRSDAAELRRIDFEYAILDEAQAIKNPATGSAKAARLLKAKHRLTLSGTPVENRIEELWSLFEFLNPGMLGPASTFGAMAESGEILQRALKPVILRRTKEQVAPELPERTEQTWYVELEDAQRAFYIDLLARTRRTVFEQVDRAGMSGSRMHILEALLRLRQAACAPVLADPTRPRLPSAKLDALVPTLAEIVDEGHKAVVFSQFTRFLALVRARLDEAGLAYEYLDGSTRHREEHVDRFQSADGPPLFLVSLKAGGHGLNLTAADYVYLLDPWWNPAVEAQAIDRAHRIGQTRHVIATRLVAKGTIEEKLLELQATKRALADSIFGAEEGGLASIGREELEMLLAVG